MGGWTFDDFPGVGDFDRQVSWEFRDKLRGVGGAAGLERGGCAAAGFAPVAIDRGGCRFYLLLGFVLAVGFDFESGWGYEVGGEFLGGDIEYVFAGRGGFIG